MLRPITDGMGRFEFRTIVESLPLVVYVDELDERSSPLYVSPQIERLLGFSPEEWLADPDLFVRCIHPDDRDGVLLDIATRNDRGHSPPASEYRLVARDGRVVWVRDDELVVDGVAHGYLQDITQQKQAELRLRLLAEVLALATEETSPHELLRDVADRLASAFGDLTVTFVEITPTGISQPRYTTNPNGLPGALPLIPEVWERWEHGTLVIDDVLDEPWLAPAHEQLEAAGVRGAVDVPLRRNGAVVSVVWFNTARPRAWSDEEVRTLSEVAAQLAVVLERTEARQEQSRTEGDLRKRDAILDAVSRAAEAFLTQPSLDDALVELMRVLGEATGARGAHVFENVDGDEGGPLALRRTTWSTGPWCTTVDDPRLAHFSPAPHFPRWADILGRGEVVAGHVRDFPQSEQDALEHADARSVMAFPIFVGDEWWGFVSLEDCERERDWSPAETDALRAAAGLVAAAIRRERAERDLRRRDAILEAVSTVAERLVSVPSWRETADDLLERLGRAAGASRAYLFECGMRPDGTRVASQLFEWVAEGITPELGNELMQDMAFGEVGLERLEDAGARNELFAGKVRDFPTAERELFAAQDICSIATVPIHVDGDWWGFIGFDDCATERDWSAAELDALRTAASLLAAAIRRERSEATLREHEQKLRAVFDTALDAIFITDDERRYVDVNPAACEYYGVERRNLIGRRIDDFLPPHRLATVEEDWRTYVAGGPILAEWEIQRADGELRVAEASAHPRFLPGLHIAFFRDVTERKRLEAELLNAQKLESLGRLAGGIAHDFNNLLTGITGYASLLLERANGDDGLRRDLAEIRRAADRAGELTRQLLAFGRRQMLQPRPLDLNAVTADVAGLLDRLVGSDVQLELRPAPRLGVVHADPGQIEQVLVNLVVNAREALPAGGRITIETRNADDGFVELVVSDDGVGMDEETMAQVFEPFFTTREDGVGLGLASVHGIVHQSGGVVSATSSPGEGSVFTVRLPAVADAGEPEPLRPLREPEPEPQPGSETILLVEDEDVVRDLTRRVLERHGYTVLACADGTEAVSLAEGDDRRIDLLLTDVVMPGLRGYEVARKVEATRPGIKVAYMSGYAEEALVGGPEMAGSLLI
jgi:PAS domain S-box-containing protein